MMVMRREGGRGAVDVVGLRDTACQGAVREEGVPWATVDNGE
jgi:hypothetical protein